MQKTCVVEVTRRVLHAMYKKYLTRRVKYKVHDPKNECKIGDTVRIMETSPISRHKHWKITKIIEKAG